MLTQQSKQQITRNIDPRIEAMITNQLERKRPLGIWSEEEETDVQCKKTTHGVN